MHQQHHAGHGWRLILLALLFAGPPAILAILFFGERGNDLVGVLSLLLAFVFGLAPFLPKRKDGGDRTTLTPAQKGWFVLGVLALSAALSGLLYQLVRVPAEPVVVAEAVRVDGRDQLTPSTPATVVFLRPTPDRENLGLRLQLEDYIGSGDCTTSATLTLTPMLGGQQGPHIEVANPGTATRPPEDVEIPVRGVVQDLQIGVALHSHDGCKLRLVVTEAVFYG